MYISFEPYWSLLEGLCYLNVYTGFILDFGCKLKVPNINITKCDVQQITPLRPEHLSKTCDVTLPDQLKWPIYKEQDLHYETCVIYYCRKRLKRSVQNATEDIPIDKKKDKEHKHDTKPQIFVKSYAFGNPSLPPRTPRKRKKRPPRRQPKTTGK